MNSFTIAVQKQVDSYWKNKIIETDLELEKEFPGKEIRQYLNDHSSLNTISLVIRRYLMRTAQALLKRIALQCNPPYLNVLDYDMDKNEDWPENFTKAVAQELYRMSKKQYIEISTASWIRYLSSSTYQLKGNTIFRIAFSLHMSVEDTQELMMACGHDGYCMRNPEHLIYYYCQKRPNAYSWIRAQKMIEHFHSLQSGDNFSANDATEGMTFRIRQRLENLIYISLPENEADSLLLRYMLENEKEFSGLSLTRRKDFLRLARYLACVYPEYYSKGQRHTVTADEERINLDELIKAMFEDGGWLGTSVSLRDKNSGKRTASSIRRRQDDRKPAEDIDNIKGDIPFLQNIQFFVDHLFPHWAAINRIYRSPKNTDNVERRDIILMLYFFLLKYPDMIRYENEYEKELDALTRLSQNSSPLDACMDSIMDAIWSNVFTEEKKGDISEDYLPLFNQMLTYFDMQPMYMPCPFDRFIYMSLYARDPKAFTEAVLWNNGDDDETASAKDFLEENILISLQAQKAFIKHLDSGECQQIITPNFALGRYPKEGTQLEKRPDFGFCSSNRTISHRHVLICFDGKNFFLADVSKINPRNDCNRPLLNGRILLPNGDQLANAEYYELPYVYLLHSDDEINICGERFIFYCN